MGSLQNMLSTAILDFTKPANRKLKERLVYICYTENTEYSSLVVCKVHKTCQRPMKQ